MRPAPVALLLMCLAGRPAGAAEQGARIGPDPGDPSAPTVSLPLELAALQSEPPLPGEPSAGWWGLTGGAPDGDLLTLDAALALARARHPLLEAARTGARAAAAERAAAGRVGNPWVEVEVLPGDRGREVEVAGGLDLTDGVLAALRVRVADARLDAEQRRAEAAAIRLESDIRTAYVAVQAAALRVAVGQRALEIQAAARDTALALSENGGLPWAEVVPHLATFERLRVVVAGLEADLATSRERLSAAIGLFGVRFAVTPLPDLTVDASVPADLESRAVAASLDLAALRHEVEALSRAATLARVGGALPDVGVGVLAANEGLGRGGLAGPSTWRVGGAVELTVPLFAQGVAAGRAAALRRDELAWRLDAAAVSLRAEVRAAAARFAAADARARHLRDVVLPWQREASAAALRQYDAMQVSVFQLLQARRAELDTELELVDALADAERLRALLDAFARGVRVDLPVSALAAPTASSTPDGGH